MSRFQKLLKIVLMVLTLQPMGFGVAFAQQQDVDTLLKRAEGALSGPGSTKVKETSSDSTTTPTTSSPKSKTPSKTKTTRPAQPPIETVTVLRPVTSESIQDIVTFDTRAQEKERDYIDPRFYAGLGGGVAQLDSSLTFQKGEDDFALAERANLSGAAITLLSEWRVDRWSNERITTRASVDVTTGVFSGTAPVQRTGIQSGLNSYEYTVAPLTLGGGLMAGWPSIAGLRLSYGFGGEMIFQTGKGENDTLTEILSGDVASFDVVSLFSKRFQIFGRFQRKGVGLISRKENKSAGNLMIAGFAVPLAG